MAYQSKTIYPSYDAGHTLNNQSSWADAREASASGIITTLATTNIYGIKASSRGSVTYGCSRYFSNYDVKGALPYGSAIMSASFSIWYTAKSGADRLVQHSTTGSLGSTGTFDSCLYGSGGSNSNEDMIALSAEYTPSATGEYTSITLNDQALTNLKGIAGTDGSSSGMFCVTVIKEIDYDDSAPSDNTTHYSTIHTDAYTGTGRDPKLVIMYENPQPLWFGTNF
jgi:hypothetical protein